MSVSGIKVDDECINAHKACTTNEKGKRLFGWVVFKIDIESGHIKIHKSAAVGEGFPEMKEEILKDRSSCYAVTVLKEKSSEKDKVILIAYINDNVAPIKEKMLYSTAKVEMTRALEGIHGVFQVNDDDEFDEEDMRKELKMS